MTKIVVLRHAEKPIDDNDQGLSNKGHLRAKRLHKFADSMIKSHADFIFATEPTHVSMRPVLTVLPYWQSNQVPINLFYADEEVKVVAKKVLSGKKYKDKTVFICWHHGKLPTLLKALGVKKGEYPETWPEEDFGTVFVLDTNGKSVTVQKMQY